MNRRTFTKLALTGTSAMLALPDFNLWAQPLAPNRSLINGVQFGIQPFCYHDLPMNRDNRPELLRRIVQNGFGMVELHATWCEPRFAAPGVSAQEARAKLREWRLNATEDYYKAIRKEFDDAGVSIFTYYINMDISPESFTEAEIDATFRAAKILGAGGCIGSQGFSATKRLAPSATKNGMFLSVHNHANISDPDAFTTEDNFARAFTISPDVVATFDTRHFTAANGDCLAFIEKHHTRIRNIHLGDRRKNQGHSVPFGQGDAPIIEILRLIRDNGWPIVVMLEFEHGTLRTGLQETQLMFDYCKRAIA